MWEQLQELLVGWPGGAGEKRIPAPFGQRRASPSGCCELLRCCLCRRARMRDVPLPRASCMVTMLIQLENVTESCLRSDRGLEGRRWGKWLSLSMKKVKGGGWGASAQRVKRGGWEASARREGEVA